MLNPPERKAPIKTGVPDHEDVNIVLRLYELRREEVMRQARSYVSFEWSPTSYESFAEILNPAHPKNAYFRQVSSFWEMACTFVNMGAVHEDLFWTTQGEALFFFAKCEPHLERARKELYGPAFLLQLETLVKRRPDGAERLKGIRERVAKMTEMAKAKR